MQGGALSFQTLEKKIQLTQLCVIARNMYKIRPNADDGWGEITILYREYLSSRSYPKTKAWSAVPEGTVIGPVLEVHVVKFLTGIG